VPGNKIYVPSPPHHIIQPNPHLGKEKEKTLGFFHHKIGERAMMNPPSLPPTPVARAR
jgi:hypothetical protein